MMRYLREIFTLPYIVIGIVLGVLAIILFKAMGFKYSRGEIMVIKCTTFIEKRFIDVLFSAIIYTNVIRHFIS